MSGEATAKEVSYKPVDIEEDTPRKRLARFEYAKRSARETPGWCNITSECLITMV